MGTRTRTVMFNDLAGYTARVAGMARQDLRKMIDEHETLMGPIVDKYGGEIVKNLGDSFMCLFDSATDALRAAVEVIDTVQASGGISMRIGLTTGDVEEIAGDAFGDAVNLAARIIDKAPAGEIWFNSATRQCMNAAEVAWESVGRFRFKGIAFETDVFRAVPRHACHLSDPLIQAAREGRLVRVRRGERPSSLLPPDPIVLLEGFDGDAQELARALATLPVLDPARLYLACYLLSPSERVAWTEEGRGLVVGKPEAIERALIDAQRTLTQTQGSDTIVIETSQSVDLVLVISGLALPAVPMSEVVSAYSYDLLPDGRWVNRSDRAVLRVEVTADGCRLQITSAGVRVNGRACTLDQAVPLQGSAVIETSAARHLFREMEGSFAGVLLADTQMRLPVVAGQTAEIGREPQHPGLAFPDRRGQSNIRWCSGPRAARARTSGFTLDRALAGRRQASVLLQGERIEVQPLHARCPTYVLREDGVLTRLAGTATAVFGDHVIAGTTVVGLRGPDAY